MRLISTGFSWRIPLITSFLFTLRWRCCVGLPPLTCGIRDLTWKDLEALGFIYAAEIWDKGRFAVKLVPATPTAVTRAHVHAGGKVPGKMFAAEAMMVWLHIAHYVQCRDSWTHLEDSPETRPGKSPKNKIHSSPSNTLLWKAAQGCGGRAAARNNSLFMASSPQRCNILHTCGAGANRRALINPFLRFFLAKRLASLLV